MQHKERAHSKFSASGAERWFNCPGSVALSEGMPDKETEWAREGTQAHELVEQILKSLIEHGRPVGRFEGPTIMVHHALNAANFIWTLHQQYKKLGTPADIMVETRVYLDFIHPEMFGTFDGAVLDHFGTLHVFDFKYGAGHSVSPKENLQMIFYGIGLAHQYHWNFKKVRLWIIQPRIKGYDGPLYWDLSIRDLKHYVRNFKSATDAVENHPHLYAEGSWCHWCKGKSKCPLKQEEKMQKAVDIFGSAPVKKGNKENGKEEKESGQKIVTEAEWRKKAREKGKRKSKAG